MRPEIQNAIRLLRCSHPQSLDAALAVLQNTIFSFSMKICGHREDSEDTMQDTLLRAARQLPNFESPEALAVWLYQVARSRCLMSRRLSKFAPQQHLSLEEVMPDRAELEALTSKHRDGSPEHQLLRAESREELQQAVLRIPPRYRLVLVLHDMEELSPVGIARVTGLRPGTVRVRLHRARAFLRNELARRPAGRRPIRGEQTPSRRCRRMFAVLSGAWSLPGWRDNRHRACSLPSGPRAWRTRLDRARGRDIRSQQHRAHPINPKTAAEIRKKLLRVFETAAQG